jgi:FLYWCH zinc finger domain
MVRSIGHDTYEITKPANCYIFDGHKFKNEKARGARSYYRCLEAQKHKCLARLIVVRVKDGPDNVQSFKAHNHEPSNDVSSTG